MSSLSLVRYILSLSIVALAVCENVDVRTYPHHVALMMVNSDTVFCSGSIISNWFILTAAECVYQKDQLWPNMRIFAGMSNINRRQGTGHAIESVYLHPNYDGNDTPNTRKPYNIALLKMTIALIFNQYQNKIDLPDSDIALGQDVTALSWGLQNPSNAQSPLVMKKTTMTVTRRFDNRTNIRSFFRNSQFITHKQTQQSFVDGNIGSSVIYNNKLAGVLSISTLNPDGLSNTNTNVFSSKMFIVALTTQRQLNFRK